MKQILAVSAIALLALTGCSADAAPAEKAPVEKVEPEAPVEEVVEEVPAEIPFGTAVVAGDWEVTLNSWNGDADAAVLEASEGTDVPEEGMQFAVLNVTMKYIGEGTGDNSAVQILYVPDSPGIASGLWEAFGTTPGDNKLTFETLTNGGEITGDALYLIQADTTGFFEVVTPGMDEAIPVRP